MLLWAALGPDGKDGPHVRYMRGAYVSLCEVREPSDFTITKEGYETQEKLWNETLEVLKNVSPELAPIAKEFF